MAEGVPAPGKASLDKAAWLVTAHIKALAVTAAKLAANAVETAKIKDANVTAAKLAADAVETAKILDANVTEAKLTASSDIGLGVLRVARAKYSFAVDGGLVSTITPASNATIPDNAIIVGGTINSTTAVTSGGAATVSIGTPAGSSAASLIGATGKASYSIDANLNMVATFAAPVKMSAAGEITLTVADAAVTAGIIEVTVLYFVAAA